MTDKPNLGGRPRLFDSPEEMQEKIDDYFQELKELNRAPTITGLNYFLGFDSRHGLSQYAKYDGFSNTVKRARMRVEEYLEEGLLEGTATGKIFNLKNNFGWKDHSSVESFDGGKTKKHSMNDYYASLEDEENEYEAKTEE